MSQTPLEGQQRILLDLVISLQRAVNVDAALARLLAAVTAELDICRAIVTLIDDEREALHLWMRQDRGQDAALLQRDPLKLSQTQNHIVKALLKGEARMLDLHEPFGFNDAYVLPMVWGVQPIGLLAVDLDGHPQPGQIVATLQSMSEQAAVSLGMMQMRHRRAKESAIQEERARLALDLHDTVSQSLFGLVSTLQACRNLLPTDPQRVARELAWALDTAEDVRRTIRATVRDLWPAELTAEQFEADLRHYAATILQAVELDIAFDVRGDFSALSPPVRRSMYRICQEALTNVVHHAGASESRICVNVSDGRAQFVIRDDGRGFDLPAILSQTYSDDHFGLRGIQERTAALGGFCRIYSQPDAGTSIVVDIPANIQEHHTR